MRRGLVVVVLAAAALFLGTRYAGVRKDLEAERKNINSAWAGVDAALTDRAGLIPDLVDTIRKEAPAETGAMQAASDARQGLERAQGPREKLQANGRLDHALSLLLLCTENYPKLQDSKPLSDLEDSLKDSEDRIAVERRKYNEAVEHYNARIEVFPDNLVASLAGLGKIDVYFDTPGVPGSAKGAL